jgi:hypothetical protein
MTIDAVLAAIVPPRPDGRGLLWTVPFTVLLTWLIYSLPVLPESGLPALAVRRWSHPEFRSRSAKTAVPSNAQERLYAVERACLTVKFCSVSHSRSQETVVHPSCKSGGRSMVRDKTVATGDTGQVMRDVGFSRRDLLGAVSVLLAGAAFAEPR